MREWNRFEMGEGGIEIYLNIYLSRAMLLVVLWELILYGMIYMVRMYLSLIKWNLMEKKGRFISAKQQKFC